MRPYGDAVYFNIGGAYAMQETQPIEQTIKDFLNWNAARVNFFSELYVGIDQGPISQPYGNCHGLYG